MKKIFYLFSLIIIVIMQSCSKSTPTGMTCDYAPYAYKQKATFKEKFSSAGNLDSGTRVFEVIGDSTVNKIQYAVVKITGTSSNGVTYSRQTTVRCGGGVYEYKAMYGSVYEIKGLVENPTVGAKWTDGPFVLTISGITMSISNYNEVVSTTATKTIQGKTYSNLVKVKMYQISENQGIGLTPTKNNFAIYYWDKISGLVVQNLYGREDDMNKEINEVYTSELISLI